MAWREINEPEMDLQQFAELIDGQSGLFRDVGAESPLAKELCMGTTVRNTLSPARFSSDTWLPFCRSSMKPALLRARTTRSPETVGSFVISFRDFDDSPEGGFAVRRRIWGAPGFQIKFNGLAQVGPRRLDIFSLRSDSKLRASGDVPFVLFGYEGGKAVIHDRNRIRLTPTGQGSRYGEFQEIAASGNNKLRRGING